MKRGLLCGALALGCAFLLRQVDRGPATAPIAPAAGELLEHGAGAISDPDAGDAASAGAGDDVAAAVHPSEVTTSSSPASVDPDAEWDSFPRSHPSLFGLAVMAETRRVGDVAALLFRHTVLNEPDAYIPPKRRQELVNRLRQLTTQLHLVAKARDEFIQTELPRLALTGKVPKMDTAPTPEKIELVVRGARAQLKSALEQQAAGADMSARIAEFEERIANPAKFAHQIVPSRPGVAVIETGDGIFPIRISSVAGGRTLIETRVFLHSSFRYTIVDWFEAEGVLSHTAAARLREDIRSDADRERAR